MKKKLYIIGGPTAVGKTELSIAFAKKFGCEIISADSMQVYKYMDIGSAKISKEEMDGVPHYLVDCLDPTENFNVARFQEMAKEAMEEIYAHGKIPLIVGGTGFYTQAVIKDIDFTENEVDEALRREIDELAEKMGADFMHDELRKVDPESADAIPAANMKRVCRAIEFYRATGEKISDHNETERAKESPYDYRYFVLNLPRNVLYDRIERRVDIMMESGLIDEVKLCLEKGCTKDMNSMQGLGYKQLIRYFDGLCSLEKAVDDIKKETRHFAKRQLTWFRREKDVIWVEKDKYSDIDEILRYMEGML